MILKSLETGPLMVNCYIVGDDRTRKAVVVDPGGNAPDILKALADESLDCVAVVNTHTHFDHIGGNADLIKALGVELITHIEEAPGLEQADGASRFFGMSSPNSPKATRFLAEGDILEVGDLKARIVELRGHSPCTIGLVFDNENCAIVGDALFAGSIGRTDLPGGNHEQLLTDIREKLFVLPDETLVCPGHGPTTTIGREKRFNPFF